jgi:hypothetical protein
MKKKYGTPYPESLGPKTFCILGFSEIWIFMQRNFNTVKINNKKYVLKYTLSIIHNFFMIDRWTHKTLGGIIFIV